MVDLRTYCGMIAGSLTTVSFLPQLIKVWKTQSAKDISAGMFVVFTCGVSLWLIYGLLLNDLPIIISNTVTLILASSILFLKLRYEQ
jgi:MtN3 and saliva related transmembrane protein